MYLVIAYKGTAIQYIHLTDFNKIIFNSQKLQEFLKNLQNVKGNLSSFGFAIQELPSEEAN